MDWENFYNNFRKPDFIPGYEIEHRLGGGAFGEVYKARKQSIGKSYAIKFLKVDEGAQREAIERELEQVRHFAAIDHPNLVTIEDMGAVLDVPYLVMGYAGELTLGKRMNQGNMSREEALSFFVQTCRGVLALHDRRLVHFDLKPGNVFLHGDVARVGDYGLSKLMTEGRLTLSFGRGTPHYMAPEMLRGRADHRADIYSLGVILFECIAGAVPYEVRSSVGVVYRENDTPPEFPADFPADLRQVAERCLRLAPEDRYDSVEELLTDLGQTARRGDSIRMEPSLPANAPGKVAAMAAAAAVQAGGAGLPGTRTALSEAGPPGELRNTAAELTRGAVEVARGVWDGLKTAKGSSTTVPKPPALGATPASGAGPARGPGFPGEEPSVSMPSAAGTVPVPPRRAGGPLGVLFSSISLAVEVFVSLVRGVFSSVRGFLRRRHASMRARSRSRFTLLLRTSFFYLLLFIVLTVALSVVAASINAG